MDVNVLVYAHREDVDDHLYYRRWLEKVLNSKTDYGYSPLVLSGFLRVVTHPKVFESPSMLGSAMQFCQQIKNQANAVPMVPKERHWSIFEELVLQTKARGSLIPDAYHAALAIESSCQWVTTDKGFKRFKGLKIFHPLDDNRG